jgi:hypothetical protein
VTDQSSLGASPCVNLNAPPAPEPVEATPEPPRRPPPDFPSSAGWVVCQICGRRGRWVNPFPEVKHDSR